MKEPYLERHIEGESEMEKMEEHHKHLLAEEILKRHNLPVLFSYRYAFILGLEEGRKTIPFSKNFSYLKNIFLKVSKTVDKSKRV